MSTGPDSFAWTGEVLAHIVAGIDSLMQQPAVMAILVFLAFITLIYYAMG